MAYYEKPILTDRDRKPIPQYFNGNTNQFEPVEGESGGSFVRDRHVYLKMEELIAKLGIVVDEIGKPKQVSNFPIVQNVLVTGGNAKEVWEGNADLIKTFPSNRFGFSIINEGIADLNFTINGVTRKVKPGWGYTNKFDAFLSVEIKATSLYRAEVFD